ncbi:reverse transcriptase [Elysia marginata]|uniref:Reverse transcriptase n=1 Tax=Elysia marginata TaxID=1093978 RepID=A0AAV4JQ54_9GAST|nr:reverse transcriptase [Elysia marginata]
MRDVSGIPYYIEVDTKVGNRTERNLWFISVLGRSEPLVRTAKGGQGIDVLGQVIRTTVYADITAPLARKPGELQQTLDRMNTFATKIGLRFDPAKCASLTFQSKEEECALPPSSGFRQQCQGAPRGSAGGLPGHTNRSKTSLPPGYRPPPENEQTTVQESLLAPWQKLEALRS